MMTTQINKVFLDKAVAQDARAIAILQSLDAHVPVALVDDKIQVIQEVRSLDDPLTHGKRMLFLSRHRGRMVSPCPGTARHICCGYEILDLIEGCPMDCSYCVLQGYLNNPVITVYVNLLDLIDQLEEASPHNASMIRRAGPGELSDSLALDPLIRFAEDLIVWFAGRLDRILELKTKSDCVDHLLHLKHGGRTVVSWSLNPQQVIDAEEHGASSLDQRLQAARKCQEAGYAIGLHMDPLIYEEAWEEIYRDMVGQIFQYVDPKRVLWISMGGLRFPPVLKSIVENRFATSRILLGELFPGKDGKLRYLESIRIHMYKKLLSWLHEIDPNLFVYLCMESHEVWRASVGWSPDGTAGLARMFDRRCREFAARSP